LKNFLFFILLFFAGQFASAGVLLTESFNYPDGAIVGVAGSPWVVHSGSAGDALVQSGKLEVFSSRSDDIDAPISGQPFATSSGAILYASFTVNFSGLPTSSGAYFAHLNAGSNHRGVIFASTSGAIGGTFRLGTANASSGSATSGQLTNNLSLNQNYFLVTRYNVGTGVSTIWLNPSAESDLGVTGSDTASPVSISGFSFRQAGSEGSMTIDDLKVGTSFADVTSSNNFAAPAISEQPQSQTVFEGATVNFNVAASGNPSPTYQWKFNTTNIPNATSSTLSLTNVTGANAGNYSVVVSNNVGSTNSNVATLTVNPAPQIGFSLLHYNVKGNGTTDWSTNTAQIQAIGREVMYLNPDIIAFNEIPSTNTWEMTNFVKAFLPGYFLATNSGTDGFIRSVIASRYPITRSTSWLTHADLAPFGYTNADFTRDLFEAQITVPNFTQPLHVFTTHLKSSSSGYTDAAAKRAAEAAAITNFFATTFFVTYPNDPYTLSGDMNEDNTNTLAIQRLISAPTGLRQTNPTNPITGSINTDSIQGSLSSRIDYIFPGGLLFSNIISSQVFRTDVLNPVPPNLQTNDDRIASDHLPVFMIFGNPYDTTFRITSTIVSNQLLTLKWQSISNQHYRIESSTTLTNWIPASATITATGTNSTFSTNLVGNRNFLRVNHLP
jgi:endonuclease/exonuclease/phosphatase family metal-dependent hydrolase